jgi:hypothetical protein
MSRIIPGARGLLLKTVILVMGGLALLGEPVQAQLSYAFWIRNVNWDGYTSWQNYIRRSPAYLGPNALALPEAVGGLHTGVALTGQWQGEVAQEWHRGVAPYRENTFNPVLNLSVPLVPGQASLEVHWRPYEWWSTDTVVRDLRNARWEEPRGHNTSELWILNRWQVPTALLGRKTPVTLGWGIKTTAGKGLENARHTNMPAYWFEVRTGRSYPRWSWWTQQGFLVWQESVGGQNDAWTWALGLSTKSGPWSLSAQAQGIVGYFNQGDRPWCLRTEASYQSKAQGQTRGRWYLRYQHALQDLPCHTWRVGYAVVWNKRSISAP